MGTITRHSVPTEKGIGRPAMAYPHTATVVGVLIEVPVMLLVANLVNRSRDWYEQGLKAPVTATR